MMITRDEIVERMAELDAEADAIMAEEPIQDETVSLLTALRIMRIVQQRDILTRRLKKMEEFDNKLPIKPEERTRFFHNRINN